MTEIRLLGAALLLFGGAGVGFCIRREKKAGLDTLSGLCAALGVLEAEVSALKSPLPGVFLRLAEAGPARLRSFFAENAAAAERGELEKCWCAGAKRLPLCAEAASAAERLGLVLGRYDAERQTGEIEFVRGRLLSIYERERDFFAAKEKIYPGVGACLGGMLAIMLI